MRRVPPSDEKRMRILNEDQSCRAWRSCDERRRCSFCERIFTAREVRVSWFRRGLTRLHCPTRGCTGGPVVWVHPGNPLLSDEAWQDWDRMIEASELNEQ